MAYNTSKGPRQLGDIKNEDDTDTRLDWEDDYIGLKTGGTTRLAISGTAGNVGIGTVNPSHTLQVNSNSGVEGLQVNGAQNQYVASFRANTTTGQSYGPYVRAGTNGSDAALVVENAAGTTSLLKLTGEGLLGIGTTSPNRMLEVQNDDNLPQLRITHTDETHFTDFSTTSNGRLRIRPSGRTVEVDTGDTNGGNVLFTKNGGTTSGGISWDTGDQDVTLYSEADLYLGAGGSSQKVMVDNGGNVGIGTTNPTHKLTVAGAISGSGTAKFVGATVVGSTLKVSGSTTLGDSAADVVACSSQLTASEGIFINADSRKVLIGAGGDLGLQHNSNNSLIVNKTGHLRLDNQATAKHIQFDLGADDATTKVQVRNNSGAEKLYVSATGQISGAAAATFVGKTVLGNVLQVSGNVLASGHISPTANNTKNLGASDKKWANLYATTVTVSSIVGGSPISLSASSIGFTGSVGFSGSSTAFSSTGSYFSSSAGSTEISGGHVIITGSSPALTIAAGDLIISGNAYLGDTGADLVSVAAQLTASQGMRFTGGMLTGALAGPSSYVGINTAGRLVLASAGGGGGGGISFNGSTANGLVTYGNASTADVESGLTYNGTTLAIAGAMTASTDLAGRSLTLDVGKTIGIAGDTDLMTLTANTVTVAGALTASTDLAGRSLTLDVGKTIGIAGDTDLVTLTANTVAVAGTLTASALVKGAGLRIDTNGQIGTASDTDLLTLANNDLRVAGQLSASLSLKGRDLTIDDGKFIGIASDTDLLRLAANSVSVNGALSASTDLSGRSLTLDVGKTIGIAGDTDLMTLTANTITVAGALTASTDLAGRSLTLDVGKTIGIAGDTDLMTLTANTVTVAGAVSGSGALSTGGTLTVAGGINAQSSNIVNAGDITGAGNVSGSGTFSCLNVDCEDAISAGGGYSIDSTTIVTSARGAHFAKISSSATIESAGNITAGGAMRCSGSGIFSGSLRAKQLHMTHHSYGTTATNEKWLPFQGTAVAGAPNNGTEKNQMVVPFNGVLKRVYFRPSGSQGGNCIIRLYKATNGGGFVNTDEQGQLVETQVVNCPASVATTSFFNFTGSSHFNAGDVVGVSVDPHANGVDFNVTCLWEFEMFGVGV